MRQVHWQIFICFSHGSESIISLMSPLALRRSAPLPAAPAFRSSFRSKKEREEMRRHDTYFPNLFGAEGPPLHGQTEFFTRSCP